MDIEALRIVVLVSQQGSFASAARILDMDPSSISRSVAHTEAALGLRIFQRSTRTLSVTEEGETYLQRISPLLDEFDHAREVARRASTAPSGTLKLTASVAFAHESIVPLLADFHERYPDISVELLPTDAILDIAANAIDLAIRLAPAPKGDLISTRLMQTRYAVCASPEYVANNAPMSDPEDLAEHNCLRFALPAYRTRWRFRKDGGNPFEVPVSGRTIIANALSLRRAAIDGLGPALLADWLVEKDMKSDRLIDLFPNHDCTATEFDTAAWMLYPSRTYLPRKVRVMIDFLRERLG
ncbi:MAG: LysR family transcriptional regulator [Rhodobacter sp.]|nr:LysR family transcriptional regulator [Rhodobacter sp.]